MKQVGSGKEVKAWYQANRPSVRRIMTPTRDSFHILNLDEVEDDAIYIIMEKNMTEIIIEEAEAIS